MLTSDTLQNAFLQNYGLLLARVCLGALFFLSGLQILLGGMAGVRGVAGMIEGKGLPLAFLLAIIVVAIKVLGGGALMLGYRSGLAAGALILFTTGTIVFFHLSPVQMGIFGIDTGLFKNLAIIGGLLYVIAYGPGTGWRLGR